MQCELNFLAFVTEGLVSAETTEEAQRHITGKHVSEGLKELSPFFPRIWVMQPLPSSSEGPAQAAFAQRHVGGYHACLLVKCI